MTRPLSPWLMLRRRNALAALGALSFASRALASDTQWLVPADGELLDPARWSSGVPTSTDTAIFGASAGASEFLVTIPSIWWSGALVVLNQSPRLALAAPDFGWLITGPSFVGGPNAPTLSVASGTFQTNGPLTIGMPGDGHGVVEAGASWRMSALQLGTSLGMGTLDVRSGANVTAIDQYFAWWIGVGGHGTLTLEQGASFIPASGSAIVVGAQGGEGTIDLSAGGAIGGEFADSASFILGGRVTPGLSAGTGRLLLDHGAVLNALGPLKVGEVGQGFVTVGNATVHALTRVGIAQGTGSVEVTGAASFAEMRLGTTLGSSSTGASGTGTLDVHGPGAALSTAHLAVGDAGVGTVRVRDGATLTSTSMRLGGTSALIEVADGGAFTVAGTTILGGVFSSSPTPTVAINVHGADAALTLAGPLQQTKKAYLALDVSDHGSLTAAHPILLNGGGTLDVTVASGGHLVVNGDFTVHSTDAPIAGTCTIDGGTIECAAFVAPQGVATTVVLGPDSVANGPALIADSVTLNGPFSLAWQDGFAPPVGTFLPVVQSSVITGWTFGFITIIGSPPVTVMSSVQDGALGLLVVDAVDAVGAELPSALVRGVPTAWTTMATSDGVAYDVSAFASWTFDPPIIARTGTTSFTPTAKGPCIATVAYGQASASYLLVVAENPNATFQLISRSLSGTFANGESGGDDGLFDVGNRGPGTRGLSANGRLVAFASDAVDLAFDGSGDRDAFVSDLSAITLLTPGLQGAPLSSGTRPSLSRNGRWVVFVSNMAPDFGCILVDRDAGTSTMVAPYADVEQEIRVSEDGRFVLFSSANASVVPGDTNGVRDVFLLDRTLGSTARVSLGLAGQELPVAARVADLSTDGRYAFFTRSAGGWKHGYRWDRLTGTVEDVTPGVLPGTLQSAITSLRSSDDGQTVAFIGTGIGQLIADMPVPLGSQAYRRELLTATTTAISQTDDGLWGNGPVGGLALSGDGRFAVFTSLAANLPTAGTPGAGQGLYRLFRRDCRAGRTELVSAATGGEGRPMPFDADIDVELALDVDGSHLAFTTAASNVSSDVVGDDLAGFHDCFLATFPPPLFADLDGNGSVDAGDLALLLGDWGGTTFDLDSDGIVAAGDVALLLGAWQ